MHALRDQATRNAEVYYRLRLEDRKDEARALAAWQTQKNSLSSDHARRCVRGLLKNTLLKEALDPLLDIPGMRSGLLISTSDGTLNAAAGATR
ncbi:uncharacterized protein J7T54_005875 [Emericellopsis cladophorae]|uniref:Uncharacterized protein n=1 Tax=Emericellopsis cladophorae TaxID=2686198 RepID=A0A9Q0BAG1_9HYPO|nr:uncharacterized protein J7T54_005875 [Emericellopsis cladophorae]KAI6777726.1 hypothetical protein J7T54_005875 [Emericellopsis cladophorae]